MEPPLLTVDELSLTPARVDDAVDWAEAQDDECAHWFDWPGRPSVERCRDHLCRVTTDTSPDRCTWAIRTPSGLAGGLELAWQEGAWNVSYFVHPDHRGRGVARRALAVVAEWAFTRDGLDALSTRVHVDNRASQKVLEATGFHRIRVEDNAEGDHQDFVYERRRDARGGRPAPR